VRLELNENVGVAGLGEAIAENRAKESELPDAVTLTEPRDLRLGDLDVGDRHALSSIAEASRRCPVGRSRVGLHLGFSDRVVDWRVSVGV
jgi:hypothetical protein